MVLIGHDDGGLLALKAVQRVRSSMNSFNVSVLLAFLLQVYLNEFDLPHWAAIF